MIFKKVSNNLNILIIFFFLLPLCYGAYPTFDFTPLNSYSSNSNLSGTVSSGVRIDLSINNNFVKSFDIVGKNNLVILNGSPITDETGNYGSSIIFKNNATRKYQLNISGTYKELNFGDELVYNLDQFGDIDYTENIDNLKKVISVVDTAIPFNFSNLNSYLKDGKNNISFVVKYPYLSYVNKKVYNYTINFKKYSNDIIITNYTNITNNDEGSVDGYIQNNNDELYYVINMNPNGIGNTGAFKKVNLSSSGKFHINVSNLQEGDNFVYFITVKNQNLNVFTGFKKVKIVKDTTPPYIKIKKATFKKNTDTEEFSFDSGDVYLSSNTIDLEIESDGNILNYSFDKNNYSKQILNNTINISLSLKKGKNVLVLMAIDKAGNVKKESHIIFFDNTKPDIIKDDLKPKEMFNGGSAHFYIQDIKGKTNKPNVQMTVFTIPSGAKTADGSSVTCSDFKNLFLRDLGQMDHSTNSKYSLNPNEHELSLLSLVSQKRTLESDNDGKFNVLVTLQEQDLTQSDYNTAMNKNKKSPKVSSVKSQNQICFILKDKYGNFNIHKETVTLDGGNTMWKPTDITTIPNTIYSGEIENTGDLRSGNGFVEFSVIARFSYIGSGKVNRITSFRVTKDQDFNKEKLNFDIDSSRTKFMFDKDTNEMVVYFAVRVKPMHIKPTDYPDKYNLAFKAYPVYTVNDLDVPIDTQNPIYFQTKINIEKPLDSAKWLTPKTLEKSIKFLGKAINYTQKAVKYTKFATVGGVIACMGMKFVHAFEVGTDKNNKEEADKNLYEVCDRVACTASPKECSIGTSGYVKLNKEIPLNSKELSSDDFKDELQFKENGKVIGGVDNLRFLGKCKIGNQSGVYITGKVEKYSTDNSASFLREITSTARITKVCVPAKFNNSNKIESINLNNIGSVCYNEEAPYYDNLRCNFFNPNMAYKGKDPSTSIISAIQCGCITDTYSHLKKYLEMEKKIQGCLKQARVGNVKGSYCERIMAQSVCDIATSVAIPAIFDNSNARKGVDQGPNSHNGFAQILANLKETDKAFNNRYKGTIFDKAGMSTSSLVNKACLWAFTGDFSLLSDTVLGAIEKNEIAPSFGPPAAESRLQGFNPLTGELSIRYMFTHGVVSGGQSIKTTYELVCDSNAPGGEFCPKGGIFISDQIPNEWFNKKVIITPKDGYQSDTIIITDPKARFWYNKLRVIHEYNLKGNKITTEPVDFLIIHKKESLPVDCHWDTGLVGSNVVSGPTGGIKCDTLFNSDAQASTFSIDKGLSGIIPSDKNKFYQDDPLFLKIGYRVQNSDTFNEDLSVVSLIKCKKGNEQIYLKDSKSGSEFFVKKLTSTIPTGFDVTTFHLLNIPKVKPNDNLKHYHLSCSKNSIQIIVPQDAQGSIKYVKKIVENNPPKSVSNYNSIYCNEPSYLDIAITKNSKINDIQFKCNGNPCTNLLPEDDSLSPMSCVIESRILPTDEIGSITKDNFEKYDPNSNAVLTNVQNKAILELPFSIGLNPTDAEKNRVDFELLFPYTGQYVTYNNNNNIDLNLKYLLLTKKSDNHNYKIEVKLSSQKYGDLGTSKCDSSTPNCQNLNPSSDVSTCNYQIKINNKNAIQDLSSENNWFSAGKAGVPLNLKYIVTDNNNPSKIIKEGVIKVYLKKEKTN